MHYFIILLCSILFGAAMGAYFGTTDYRIRNDKKLMTKDCFCPICHHKLSITQQIPIVSWVYLRGRCYYCNAPIPFRYPLIEGGFILYYVTSFLLFLRRPAIIPFAWFGFVCSILVVRSIGHFRSMIKGVAIFASFHAVYGLLLYAILSSLKTLDP